MLLRYVVCLAVVALATVAWRAPKPTGARLKRPLASVNERPYTQVDLGAPFGKALLVDEVQCGDANDAHLVFEHPAGASRVEQLLDQPCRVLIPSDKPSCFSYRVGQGRGLKAGAAYVLAIQYPEDAPRSMFVLNRGAELARGIHTGQTLGDVLYTYTDSVPESLQIPLSGKYETSRTLFYLHERFVEFELDRDKGKRPLLPADGFEVIIAQAASINDPLSRGAAVRSIKLYEIADRDELAAEVRMPAGLPHRHLFWREEMSDSVIASKVAEERGVQDETTWYEHKLRLMQFLGMNTFSKDLLEFGHNQGWDSESQGGWKWMNVAQHPKRWEQIIGLLEKHKLSVLPYYEYGGSIGPEGLGSQRRARPLGDEPNYTHIGWTETGRIDVTDPAALEDIKRILRGTIVRYKDRVSFVGAWLRPRPSQMPISFGDDALARFSKAANDGKPVTREQLRKDEALCKRYYAWWFEQRKAFLVAVRTFLADEIGEGALLLFTPYVSETGPGIGEQLATDETATWDAELKKPGHKKYKPIALAAAREAFAQSLTREHATWAQWEWQHSVPRPDPAAYRDTPGIALTYPFNRTFTLQQPQAIEPFRGEAGLAMVRHYSLNEDALGAGNDQIVGYFVADVDRAGRYSMLPEVLAMAHGDPHHLGYLAGSSFNRAFPEYAREFNLAFLALPALPSTVLPSASNDKEILVRAITTKERGTYLAVAHTGLTTKRDVVIQLPTAGKLVDAATGKELKTDKMSVRLDLEACQLRALHLLP